MTYIKDRAPVKFRDNSTNALSHGSARNWYLLEASHVGAKELPAYGRTLRVNLSGSGEITLGLVPVDQVADTEIISTVSQSEILLMSARRIVSINGGTSIPAGVEITVFTT